MLHFLLGGVQSGRRPKAFERFTFNVLGSHQFAQKLEHRLILALRFYWTYIGCLQSIPSVDSAFEVNHIGFPNRLKSS